jgi:hypothetical protein
MTLNTFPFHNTHLCLGGVRAEIAVIDAAMNRIVVVRCRWSDRRKPIEH